MCTDLSISQEIVQWVVRRWQVEVTSHEVLAHLGVETQRQWADLSILRITPALLGLFSIVTLLANCCTRREKLPVQRIAWYPKKLPTFSDALALVKETLLIQHFFSTSLFRMHVRKTKRVRSLYRYSRSFHTFSRVPFVSSLANILSVN